MGDLSFQNFLKKEGGFRIRGVGKIEVLFFKKGDH